LASKKPTHNTVESQDPETAGQVMVDLAADPYANIKRVAEAHGLPPGVARGLAKRLRQRYLPLQEGLRRAQNKDFLELLDDRILRILDHMDDYTIANAELRDLAVALGILTEKRQLLKGEPTQIIDNQERQSMNELLKGALKEAQRRGMTIDVTPYQVDGEEGDSTRVLAPETIDQRTVDQTHNRMRRQKPPEMK